MSYFNLPDLVRFGTYNFLAAHKYGLPVRTTLVLLKRISGHDRLTGVFVYGSQSFQYNVVRLWEASPQSVLTTPGLIPLLPLTSATLDDMPGYLELAKQTAAEANPDVQKEMWLAMSTFSGLVYSHDQTTRFMEGILKMVDLRESTTYQEILREGEAKGKIEGKEEVVSLLLSRRFSTLPPDITQQLDNLSSSQFDDLALALLDFRSLADLQNWIGERREGS